MEIFYQYPPQQKRKMKAGGLFPFKCQKTAEYDEEYEKEVDKEDNVGKKRIIHFLGALCGKDR